MFTSQRKAGMLQTGANVIAGAIEVFKFVAQTIRDKRKPRRARVIFDANPSPTADIYSAQEGINARREDAP